MKCLLVFNPKAANGRAKKLIDPIITHLKTNAIDPILIKTEYKGHAEQILSETDLSQYNAVAIAGGDGSLFEAVNGLMKNKSSVKIPLGIIPVGTGNAFAKDLMLDTNQWKQALDYIIAGRTRPVDLGYCQMKHQSFYFANIVGLGFVSDVNATAQNLKFLGNIAYTLGVFKELIRLKPTQTKITANGMSSESPMIFVEISNTRYTSNFLMAPEASLDDGKLDITVLKPMSRMKLIRSFPKIFTGEHVHLDEVDSFQTDYLEIETEVAKVLTPDGELIGSTPVKISCVPRALEVFCSDHH